METYLRDLTNDGLQTIVDAEREAGRAFGERAEACRLLLQLRSPDGRTPYCSCDRPIMDVEHDAGCRRCGLPVNFTPAACAVCGGPDADGNGCEFCPAVERDTAAWL